MEDCKINIQFQNFNFFHEDSISGKGMKRANTRLLKRFGRKDNFFYLDSAKML